MWVYIRLLTLYQCIPSDITHHLTPNYTNAVWAIVIIMSRRTGCGKIIYIQLGMYKESKTKQHYYTTALALKLIVKYNIMCTNTDQL